MNLSQIQIAYLFFAYLAAAVPFGVIVSKMVLGKDVRKQGSGNIGATNIARMMGKKWGVLVLALDALKGFAVVFVSGYVGDGSLFFANIVACVAVAAHCYPIYLKFRGGKGVATALGVIAALSLTLVGVCFLVFAIILGMTRRMSAGSLAAALALPVVAACFQTPLEPVTGAVITAVIWWKHSENIRRILAGQEPKFF